MSYIYQDTAAYPDYFDICYQLMDYLNDPSHANIPLDQLEHTLAQHLLHNYSEAISHIAIELQ